MAAKPEKPTALGHDGLGANINLGYETVSQPEFVDRVVTLSGLSVEDWNALDDEERYTRMNGVAQALRTAWGAAQGGGSSFLINPDDPNLADVRVKQAMIISNPDGGQPHQFKVGLNRDVPLWAANNPMVQDNLED